MGGWGDSGYGGISLGITGGPVVKNVSPASGGSVNDSSPISFDVTSAASGLEILITFEFPNLVGHEVAFDTSNLAPLYRNPSGSALTILGGYTFNLLRYAEWPDVSFKVHVYAFDDTGAMTHTILDYTVTRAASPVSVARSTVRGKASVTPFGFGLVRPLRRSAANNFASSDGIDLVRSAVGQILGTSRGEVPWRPTFGTYLTKLRHMRNSDALAELARTSIEEALRTWEPRVDVLEVKAETIKPGNENKLLLSLIYRVGNGPTQGLQIQLA